MRCRAHLSTDESHAPAFSIHRLAASDDVCLLALRGELDLHAAAALRAALEELELRKDQRLVLDLSRLAFIDCSGLRVLTTHRNTLVQRPTLLGPSPFVSQLLDFAGATDAFEVAPTPGPRNGSDHSTGR